MTDYRAKMSKQLKFYVPSKVDPSAGKVALDSELASEISLQQSQSQK